LPGGEFNMSEPLRAVGLSINGQADL